MAWICARSAVITEAQELRGDKDPKWPRIKFNSIDVVRWEEHHYIYQGHETTSVFLSDGFTFIINMGFDVFDSLIEEIRGKGKIYDFTTD